MLGAIVLLATLDLNGFVSLRGMNATGPTSWTEGGWGRLGAGGDRDEAIGVAQLAIDWTPAKWFDVHVSGGARRDPGGEQEGLIEAHADLRASFGFDELQLRAGQFFLPTSRENKDDLWQSPYTIHFSALNSWIGEEFRPLGADLQYRHVNGRGHAITAAATAFRGNDTMGALLAWRGWATGDRLTTYGEVLPLPPLQTLPRFFPLQRDGTQPFGRDLDGNTGYSARLRYAVPQRGNIQYTFVDNRGDRALHRGEYAWATSFHLLGAEIGNADRVIVATEYMRGRTGMGHAPAFVDSGFYAAYALLSVKRNRNRWSGRYEIFETSEEDFSIAELNEENGRAWTFTWLFELTEHARLGAEFEQVVGDRPGTPDPNGRAFTLEARYRW